MKSLHELLKGKVVNCQTEEEAKEFLSFMHEDGYKWVDGTSLIYMTCFSDGVVTCYSTNNVNNNISYSSYSDKALFKNKGYEVITYQQFKQLINENNMETKEVKIQVPEGYEIDKENSTFDCIKFKPIKKVLTYEDVAKKLFKDKKGYYTDERGIILSANFFDNQYDNQYLDENNCTSEKQAQKLLAINKLMNVAKYLNGDWNPNWEDNKEDKYYIKVVSNNLLKSCILIGRANTTCSEIVHFKSMKLIQQAIEILGKETIKLALSTDW